MTEQEINLSTPEGVQGAVLPKRLCFTKSGRNYLRPYLEEFEEKTKLYFSGECVNFEEYAVAGIALATAVEVAFEAEVNPRWRRCR